MTVADVEKGLATEKSETKKHLKLNYAFETGCSFHIAADITESAFLFKMTVPLVPVKLLADGLSGVR